MVQYGVCMCVFCHISRHSRDDNGQEILIYLYNKNVNNVLNVFQIFGGSVILKAFKRS